MFIESRQEQINQAPLGAKYSNRHWPFRSWGSHLNLKWIPVQVLTFRS